MFRWIVETYFFFMESERHYVIIIVIFVFAGFSFFFSPKLFFPEFPRF